MVGVAGKSKGCNTCRRRKVKCDMTKPCCNRCTKAGLECEGYERYAVFIRKGIDGWEKRKPLEEARPRKQVRSRNKVRPRDISLNPTLPLQLESIAVEATPFLDHFYRTFVCPPQNGPLKQDYMDPISWSRGLESMKGSDSLLHGMILAVSMVYSGKTWRDRDLLRQGRKWYSRSLCQLYHVLSGEDLSNNDEVLVTTSVCMAYETIDPSDPVSSSGWNRHLGGMTKLLQLRGPASFVNVRSRDVLEDFRYMHMMSGMMRRKSSFLIEEPWMTAPWASCGKSVQQRVIDCGLLLGNIFERMDRTRDSMDTPDPLMIIGLANECLSVDKTLQSIAAELAPTTEIKLPIASSEGPPISTAMFETATGLRLMINLLGIRLRIYETLRSLNHQFDLLDYDVQGSPTAHEQKALATLALDLISRYLEFNIGSISKGRHVFALEHAKTLLDDDEDQISRGLRLFHRIPDEGWISPAAQLERPDDLDSWCIMVTNPQKLRQRESSG